MDISLVVLTFNNEKTIEKAFSHSSLFSEIIVVDSGSTDRTIEIVKKYTKYIYTRKFANNFSDQKNYGIEKVQSDWVFFLDSDEQLSKELAEYLEKFKKIDDVDGYWFRRRNYISQTKYLKYGLFYPDYQLRLFRKRSEYKFVGLVHEMLNIPEVKTREINLDINHFPGIPKYTSFRDFHNFEKYNELMSEELEKLGEPSIRLYLAGITRFGNLFFGGFLRGKGFLDGWDGFRSHLIFAFALFTSYWMAARKSNRFI